MNLLHEMLLWNRERQARRRIKKARKNIGHLRHLAGELANALTHCTGVPVVLVSYNNATHVRNMTAQLNRLGVKPIVIDNASPDSQARGVLKELAAQGTLYLVQARANFGHQVGFLPYVHEVLPDTFAYSDPDLQFDPDMPSTFIEDLTAIAQAFNTYKAGCALPLHVDGMQARSPRPYVARNTQPFAFEQSFTLMEWESRFWLRKLAHEHEIYAAPIDTTFAVYLKKNFKGDFFEAVRVGGRYAAIHLPWFPELDPMPHTERQSYGEGNLCSSWVEPPKPQR